MSYGGGGNGGGTTTAATTAPAGGAGIPGLGTITQFTSKVKPFSTYMILGGGVILLATIFLKKKVPKELMYVGVAFLIFGLYLKYGSRVGLPG